MSKFNTSTRGSDITVNRSGNKAYAMDEHSHLLTAVLTTFVGEEKYYGSTDSEIRTLAESLCGTDPEFVAKLAVFARKEFNLRSVSHVLASIIADKAPQYTSSVLDNIILRADDILEIMACYHQMHLETAKRTKTKGGHTYAVTPYPNSLKRGIARNIQKFDEYSLAKYNRNSKSFSFSDVIRITHPRPKDEATSVLLKKVLSDGLETPYTWETELSAKGNTKEVWNELIKSGKVGYMALLRNLRNILKCGADSEPVLEFLSSPERVRKSRQLPFRYVSAYRELDSEGLMDDRVFKCLESALRTSIENMERIQGRTLIAIDESGSMSNPLSSHSRVKCFDIANLLGILASSICEECVVMYFDCSDEWDYMDTDKDISRGGWRIATPSKSESILHRISHDRPRGGGTDMTLPMKYALNEKTVKPFDRVIIFSDNETNANPESTIQPYANRYRRDINPNLWVHAVDLEGYGTQQFIGDKTSILAGWSEKVLTFISLVERDKGSLIEHIRNIQL